MSDEVKVKELFYGADKVIEVIDGHSAGLKRIKTESWADDFPEYEVELSLSSEPRGLSDVRNSRANYIVKEIMELFKRNNVYLEDLDAIVRKLLNTFEMNDRNLFLKALGKSNKNDVRIRDLDNFLKAGNEKVNQNCDTDCG